MNEGTTAWLSDDCASPSISCHPGALPSVIALEPVGEAIEPISVHAGVVGLLLASLMFGVPPPGSHLVGRQSHQAHLAD
jgi:hypothetical protein